MVALLHKWSSSKRRVEGKLAGMRDGGRCHRCHCVDLSPAEILMIKERLFSAAGILWDSEIRYASTMNLSLLFEIKSYSLIVCFFFLPPTRRWCLRSFG